MFRFVAMRSGQMNADHAWMKAGALFHGWLLPTGLVEDTGPVRPSGLTTSVSATAVSLRREEDASRTAIDARRRCQCAHAFAAVRHRGPDAGGRPV
jgi:hypothetical protein